MQKENRISPLGEHHNNKCCILIEEDHRWVVTRGQGEWREDDMAKGGKTVW